VVNPGRIVLGQLRKAELDGDPSATVEQVMRPGPKTFRPNVTLEELLKSMRDHGIQTYSLVTTLDGRLLGVISRADAEATLAHDSAAKEEGPAR
jgi:predicted transcriptional regulator